MGVAVGASVGVEVEDGGSVGASVGLGCGVAVGSATVACEKVAVGSSERGVNEAATVEAAVRDVGAVVA